MSKFEAYLKELAQHEKEKTKGFLKDPQQTILVHAGISLNWLGDFFANPEIEWVRKSLLVEKIQFTGTNPEWNRILTDQCKRSVAKFRSLIKKYPELESRFRKEASFGDEIILVRKSEDKGFYKALDGMHRFMGAVLQKKKHVWVYLAVNEDKHLPICEAHVVYDLIRGFCRHAHDEQGKEQLYHALKLLSRTYANVFELLRERFNADYVHDNDAQAVITRVLQK